MKPQMKIKTTLLIYLNTLTKYHLLAFTYNNIAEHYDFINGHNFVTNTIGINALRSQAVQNIFGDVLEVGAGTGIQSDSYNWHTIKKYTAIDNSAEMLARLKHRILAGAPANNRVENNNFFALAGDANDIPLPSSNFDTLVDTFSMCVYKNPNKVLSEMKRLVKPLLGRIVLVENSRSTFAPLAWLQDLTEPFITPLSKGCKWNIDVPKLAVKEGLDEIVSERRSTFAGLFTLRVYRKLS